MELDDKFQERVEGKRKYNRRADKAAVKSMLQMVTCGRYTPRKRKPKLADGAAESADDDDENDKANKPPENLAPSAGVAAAKSFGALLRRAPSTYAGKLDAEGRKSGQGVEKFADGTQYLGSFAAGKRCGRGTVLYADGKAQVSRFADDVAVDEYIVWNAGRVKAWRVSDDEILMRPVALEEAATIADGIGLPMPPIHADDRIVDKEAEVDFVARHPLSVGAYVRCYVYALLLALAFDLTLKLTAVMWFIVRALTSVPLYGLVPRLFYLEWLVHFRQKRIIQSLDYAAWRPVAPALAPFFFAIYLPRMGIRLPNIELPDLDWPDIDWPDIDCTRSLTPLSPPVPTRTTRPLRHTHTATDTQPLFQEEIPSACLSSLDAMCCL